MKEYTNLVFSYEERILKAYSSLSFFITITWSPLERTHRIMSSHTSSSIQSSREKTIKGQSLTYLFYEKYEF